MIYGFKEMEMVSKFNAMKVLRFQYTLRNTLPDIAAHYSQKTIKPYKTAHVMVLLAKWQSNYV